MPASDPTFSLPTAAPGCPRTIQHPLPPASRDAPCPLYRSLSSQSTQRAPSSSLRAGTRTLSEPAGGSVRPRSASSTDPWAACPGWIHRANDEFKTHFLLPLPHSKVSAGLGMLGVCLGRLCVCVWRQKDEFACLVSEM